MDNSTEYKDLKNRFALLNKRAKELYSRYYDTNMSSEEYKKLMKDLNHRRDEIRRDMIKLKWGERCKKQS